MTRHALLHTALDAAYSRVRTRLDGLTDDEFFWQPVPDCWTIYKEPGGRWTYHYAEPDPQPAPVTTVGWQLVHLATCKLMYHEWAFGPARLTWPELDIPHTASEAMALLDRGQGLLRDDLDALSEESQLDQPRRTNWGELWPAWRIFWTMIDHDTLHGGAIGQLRDLYIWSRH